MKLIHGPLSYLHLLIHMREFVSKHLVHSQKLPTRIVSAWMKSASLGIGRPKPWQTALSAMYSARQIINLFLTIPNLLSSSYTSTNKFTILIALYPNIILQLCDWDYFNLSWLKWKSSTLMWRHCFLAAAFLNLKLELELTTSSIPVHEPEQGKTSVAKTRGIVFLVVWILNSNGPGEWDLSKKSDVREGDGTK